AVDVHTPGTLHAKLNPGLLEDLLIDFAVTLRSGIILYSFSSHWPDKFRNSGQAGSGFPSPGQSLPRRFAQHFTERAFRFLLFGRSQTHTEGFDHFSLSRVREHLYLVRTCRTGKGNRERPPLPWCR